MASKSDIVEYILEQIAPAGPVFAKKMFGEYAIYCNDKIVALICDNQLFIKPTNVGKDFIKNYTEECPYPGAKPYLLISGDLWEDSDWLSELVKITTNALPMQKKKVSKNNRA